VTSAEPISELKPHERICYTDKIDAAELPGEMQTTITLKPVFCGSELNITQAGVPAAIPLEACKPLPMSRTIVD